MNLSRPYKIRAVLGVYILVGIVIALAIHLIVLSSPRYNWIFPVTNTTTSTTMVNPAPGAK
jgi:hypothetical protein